VIGGLVFATLATLLLVPTLFSLVHGRARTQPNPGAVAPAGLVQA
jgi:Cu/Ag efflux pump CusA